MTSFQRIRKFLTGLITLLGSFILVLVPVEGYAIVAILLSLSMLLSGIRSLGFYITMARNMVGGKSILYKSLIYIDLGLFTLTAITIPGFYLICHLLISHAFSGMIDVLKAFEDKRLQSSSWRMSMICGLGNLLTAAAAFACLLSSSAGMVMYIYCAGLAYSGIMKMASSFRKTAIIYIP